MSEYRDYGYMEGWPLANPPLIEVNKRTQVWQATHSEDGNRLPYMHRSFISFSYGGRNIEDFGLIATTVGDRISRNIYADFNNNTTDSNIFDGSIFHSSHYKANGLELTLATDGITLLQLDKFRAWFVPGKERELILAETPNRAIMARIANVPQYSMLPFETQTLVCINGTTYVTSTTLYKGEIKLNFIMDDPFWYAIKNVLDIHDGNTYTNTWKDANGNVVAITDSNDALKILTEDSVVTSESMMSEDAAASSILFGDGNILTINTAESSIGMAVLDAYIAYHITTSSDSNITINDNNSAYFYYGGNAPCAPIITFSFQPIVDNEVGGTGYIVEPRNLYSEGESKYNTLTFESLDKKELFFTLPPILNGYNLVINIFTNISETDTWEDIKIRIRDLVKHYKPRQYAMLVIDNIKENNSSTSPSTLKSTLINDMINFLSGEQVKCTINCKNGQTQTEYVVNKYGDNAGTETIKENSGSMILSNYILIENLNFPDDNGLIRYWSEDHPEYSHKVYSDIELNNFNLEYKFQYL